MYAGIENGWFVGEIADAAYRFEREVNSGDRLIVGVNSFTEGGGENVDLLSIDPGTEEIQLKRVAEIKQSRDSDLVQQALNRLSSEAADPKINLMPAIIEAVKVRATEGEIVNALESVFGTYVEKAFV